MKPAADVIAHAAKRHRAQRLHHHGPRHVIARALVLAQQEQQFTGPRKLRRVAEPATPGIEGLCELLVGLGQRPRIGCAAIVLPLRHLLEARHHLSRRLDDVQPVIAPGAADLGEHIDKSGPAPLRPGRIVGAAEEGLQVGRQPHTHGPPAGAGRRLHERHVDAVDVRTFFAVDLDGNKVIVQNLGHAVVLERLALHDVTPVAGGVADGKKDWLPR